MKSRYYILSLLLSVVMTTGFSSDKTREEQKDEKKLDKRSRVEMMINSRDFVFIPRIALPSGMKPVNLATDQYNIKFQPYFIDSYMPFFGRAYSAVGYGNDTGLSFKGKPEKIEIGKNRKTFQVNVIVKGGTDIFRLFLSIGFEGSASLSISSDNRSTISFQGEISAPEKNEIK